MNLARYFSLLSFFTLTLHESTELDICMIIDGRVVVGEAKSNGRLGSDDRARDGPPSTWSMRLSY